VAGLRVLKHLLRPGDFSKLSKLSPIIPLLDDRRIVGPGDLRVCDVAMEVADKMARRYAAIQYDSGDPIQTRDEEIERFLYCWVRMPFSGEGWRKYLKEDAQRFMEKYRRQGKLLEVQIAGGGDVYCFQDEILDLEELRRRMAQISSIKEMAVLIDAPPDIPEQAVKSLIVFYNQEIGVYYVFYFGEDYEHMHIPALPPVRPPRGYEFSPHK